jgi:hypothetical protein
MRSPSAGARAEYQRPYAPGSTARSPPARAVPNLTRYALKHSASEIEFLGEMRDLLHSRALLPLILPNPLSPPRGRRESLGVLKPKTRKGTQRLDKNLLLPALACRRALHQRTDTASHTCCQPSLLGGRRIQGCAESLLDLSALACWRAPTTCSIAR